MWLDAMLHLACVLGLAKLTVASLDVTTPATQEPGMAECHLDAVASGSTVQCHNMALLQKAAVRGQTVLPLPISAAKAPKHIAEDSLETATDLIEDAMQRDAVPELLATLKEQLKELKPANEDEPIEILIDRKDTPPSAKYSFVTLPEADMAAARGSVLESPTIPPLDTPSDTKYSHDSFRKEVATSAKSSSVQPTAKVYTPSATKSSHDSFRKEVGASAKRSSMQPTATVEPPSATKSSHESFRKEVGASAKRSSMQPTAKVEPPSATKYSHDSFRKEITPSAKQSSMEPAAKVEPPSATKYSHDSFRKEVAPSAKRSNMQPSAKAETPSATKYSHDSFRKEVAPPATPSGMRPTAKVIRARSQTRPLDAENHKVPRSESSPARVGKAFAVKGADRAKSKEDGKTSSHLSASDSGRETKARGKVVKTNIDAAEDVSRATLNEKGYKQVAGLRSKEQMKNFIRRVVRSAGLFVASEAGLDRAAVACSTGRGPHHFTVLADKISTAASEPGSWVTIISPKNKYMKRQPGPPDEPYLGPGLTAPLSQDGYEQVAKLRNNSEMVVFIQRLINRLGFRVSNRFGLMGIVPWFSGETATQNFRALHMEIQNTAMTPGQWVSTD